ncbi:MAG: DUF5069 domain-containing protein [Verrucomicrobiota bacterium]|nr:DUF5069 domain-containing protein [Verrucomicrobiota bacterium]
MKVEGLRSPYEKVCGIIYAARLLDKVRLHQAGQLPEGYHKNLGGGFDARLMSFINGDYVKLQERVKQGGSDEEIIQWLLSTFKHPTDFEIEMFNAFLSKRGWRDDAADFLQKRKVEDGFGGRENVVTFFDLIEADEEPL